MIHNIGFRVLGPVSVVCDGRNLDLGTPKLRALAAVLFLNVGEAIPSGRLSAYLWDEPPRSAKSNLRSFVSQLRKKVTTADGQLERVGDAYVLQVASDRVDAWVFDDLVRQAKILTADGAYDEADTRYREALSLWTGFAGAGARGGVRLGSYLYAMETDRATVKEATFALRLVRGDYLGLCADIKKHLIDWPLSERAWELLIRTEALSGNVAEALDAYHQYRKARSDHLGLSASAAMSRINNAVIADRLVEVPLNPLGTASVAALPR